MLKLDRGINTPEELEGEQQRLPCICLRSSVHKMGSAVTPWEDVHRPDLGYSRYFGDNKVDSGNAAHESLGNRRMLGAFALHGGDERARLIAPPILVFEARAKGVVLFHGFGVLTRAELVVQRDPVSGRPFTNYRYDVTHLDLARENENLDWDWINARRDQNVSAQQALSHAPHSWREWVHFGNGALERLQRRVLNQFLVDERQQRLAPSSDEGRLLREVYDFYEGRKHRFELLADFVTSEVLRSQNVQYRPGWITRGTGDGGVDFVGRIDLDPVGNFPSSRQVLLGQAKCELLNKPTGGNHLARLAARLRRGWLGSYVTTSYFSAHVQREVLEDRYPLLMINGARVAATLQHDMFTSGRTLDQLLAHLDRTYDARLGSGDPDQVLL